MASSSVNSRTLQSYDSALAAFDFWFKTLSRPPPLTFRELDHLLAEYFGLLFIKRNSRGSRQSCINARCAIFLRCPEAKLFLPFSQKVLAGWDRKTPSTQLTPCPYELVLVLAEHFITTLRLDCAVLVLMAADSYLRISELLTALPAHLFLPSPSRPGGLALPVSKGGRNQSVTFRSKVMIQLLIRYLSSRSASESRIFDLTPASFNAALKQALRQLGVDPCIKITAHCFRHGGATYDYLRGVPMADIVQRGRWKDAKTAQNYIQAAQAILLSTKLPRLVLDRGGFLMLNPDALLS